MARRRPWLRVVGEMLVVETVARTRRAHFVQGKTIKAISRELGIARNTIRKVLRSGATSFAYAREVQPRPKLGRWTEELERRLIANDRLSRRERLGLIRIFEELRAAGYEGGYDAVRRYDAARRRKQGTGSSDAFVPLTFAPGEAYQFDWSHEIVVLGGVTTEIKVAQMRLCHSRMLFVRAYPRETQEMVFDAHDKAFAFFRGACQRGIYDNMRTAVDAVFVGRERVFNRRFLQMCSHYLVEPTACTPASGWEKGQVENQVNVVRERFFKPRLRFATFAEMNAWLLDRCVAYARGQPHPERRDSQVWEMFEAERSSLVRYAGPFDGFHAKAASVSKTCLVQFDKNKYSVMAQAVGRPVDVHAYAERIVVRQDGAVIADHARCFGREQTVYDPWHYVPGVAARFVQNCTLSLTGWPSHGPIPLHQVDRAAWRFSSSALAKPSAGTRPASKASCAAGSTGRLPSLLTASLFRMYRLNAEDTEVTCVQSHAPVDSISGHVACQARARASLL